MPAEDAERLRTAVLTDDLPVDYDPAGWPCADGGDCALSFTVGGVTFGAFDVIDLPAPSGPVVTDTPHGTVRAIPGVDPAWVLALDDPEFGPIALLSSLAERAGVQILTPLHTGPVRATLIDDNDRDTTLELTYTGDPAEQRGICWTIEHWDTDPGIWTDPHHVLAAPAGDPPPSNPGPVPATEPHECPAEALTGPGPDHIRLPAGFLAPGTHRICSALGEPATCTTFRTAQLS